MHTLTNQQIEAFRQQGYLGPFEVWHPTGCCQSVNGLSAKY